MLKEKLKYFRKNWKLVIHLLFLTKKFGVNNQWWNKWSSVFGISWKKRLWRIVSIYPIIHQYKWMKYRAIHLGGIHPQEAKKLWSMDQHSYLYKNPIDPLNPLQK